jgi:hypothetical protein
MKKRMKRHAVVQPLDQSYKIIALTQGQNALVSTEDYDFLMQWNWHAHWRTSTKSFYACRVVGRGQIGMHAAVLRCGQKEADHRNHDTLDNRRENLRKSTVSQNAINRQWKSIRGYKGVGRFKKKWGARIQVNGTRKFLGLFSSAEEAARAYDSAAKELHGEFANLNFS